MKFLRRLCALTLFFSCLTSTWAQDSSLKVSQIVIKNVGPPAASDDFVRANLRIKVGDPYMRVSVDDDVRNLYTTGLYYNIQTGGEVTNDSVIITYVLQGKPRLTEIKFQGNSRYSDSKLKKKLTSKIGAPLDEQKLFTDCQEIQKMYQKGGYPGTTVHYILNIDQPTGHGTATIEINESKKIKVMDVEFVGASAFTQKQLRKVLKTRRHWMFSWITSGGVFKDEQFEDDKDRLAEYYRNKGYIDFELKDVQFEYPTPRSMIIKLIVYEGRQYKVGSVKFTGNKLFSAAEIASGMRALTPTGVLLKKTKLGPNGLLMDVGDTFTAKGYADDMQQVQDFYGSKGYLDVASTRGLDLDKIPNTDTGTMDLEFKLDEGQKSYIEKIDIHGNNKTKDIVIRRELAVTPGEVFDMVRVRRSQQILQGLQYFGHVDLRPEPTDPPISGYKDLSVNVEEASTGNMTVGAGFSSIDSLVGFAEITQGNFDLFHPPTFTGGGQKFRLRVQLGTQRQDYLASFVEPWFLGRRIKLGVDLYYRNLDYQSLESLYDERHAGGRVGLLVDLQKPRLLDMLDPQARLVGGVGYTIENVGIIFNGQIGNSNGVPFATPYIPPTLLQQRGYSMLSKFDGSLSYDTRGPGLLPDKGQETDLSADIAGPFGGQQNYYKLELKSHWYFKGFFPGHVLEVLGGVGSAQSFDGTSDVPFYDRYFLGGIDSMRGFRYRSVSPRDPPDFNYYQSKEPVGGDSYWFGSIEYSLPIIERLRVAAFYDIGNVELGSYDYNLRHFDDNWGVGLRLNLPIGGQQGMPLRLDYGIPIHHDQYNGASGRFQFSAGFERPF